MSVWTHCVPPDTAAIRLHDRGTVVLLAMVTVCCNSASCKISNLSCDQKLSMSPQIVNTSRKCLLMGKFSPPLGADPACSAGVRQVCVCKHTPKLLLSGDICLHCSIETDTQQD